MRLIGGKVRYKLEFDEDFALHRCWGCRGLGIDRKDKYMCSMVRNNIELEEMQARFTRPIWCPLVLIDLGEESIRQRMKAIEIIKGILPATDKTLADIKEIEDSIRNKVEIKHEIKRELFNEYGVWIYD